MIGSMTASERDVLGPGDGDADHGSIEMGTVGWDDGDDFIDQGGEANDGNTLVKVTLFRGRDQAEPLKKGVAQGHKVVCQISCLHGFIIPQKGQRVIVAIPAGMGGTPGAATIIGLLALSPTQQFGAKRVMQDYGPDTHVLIRAKSVTLQSYADPHPQYIAVGTPASGGAPGIYLCDETGSGATVQSGVLGLFATDGASSPTATAFVQLKDGEVSIVTGGGTAGAKWEGGDVQAFGTNFYAYTAGTYLGATAVASSAALYMAGGSPTPSMSVFIGT